MRIRRVNIKTNKVGSCWFYHVFRFSFSSPIVVVTCCDIPSAAPNQSLLNQSVELCVSYAKTLTMPDKKSMIIKEFLQN